MKKDVKRKIHKFCQINEHAHTHKYTQRTNMKSNSRFSVWKKNLRSWLRARENEKIVHCTGSLYRKFHDNLKLVKIRHKTLKIN